MLVIGLPTTPVCTALPLAAGRIVIVVMLALAAMLCAACSSPDDPVKVLADYNERIARALDARLPTPTATRVPTWPTGDDILQNATDLRITVFGGPDFGRCSLLRELSTRSSSADRIQTPPQRLLYEMRLLRGLRQCGELTAADLANGTPARREFATNVIHVGEIKRRDLPVIYWNATFGARELRDLFSVGARPLRMRQVPSADEAANALSWLAALGRLTPDDPLPATEALEQQYLQLAGNKLGGRTWLTIDLASRELDRSSVLLEQAAATQPPCPNGRPGPTADSLQRAYTEIYLSRIDPWLASVSRGAWMLTEALEQLWQAQQITPPPAIVRYRARVWAKERGSLMQDYDTAVRRHTHAWQAALGPCGYPPAAR
ncbi:MAG: DUF3080 family protein [Pseudomonadota bacterium]